MNPRLPWLDYAGQNTSDLLAAGETHRMDSLLCAFEEAIQAKEASGEELTPEEQIVLAVEALQREVNNGGFHQFFGNSSSRYAPIIAESLHRIAADDAAELAASAIAALHLTELTGEAAEQAALQASKDGNQELIDALDACDQIYYGIGGIDEKLFAFVLANAAQIRV